MDDAARIMHWYTYNQFFAYRESGSHYRLYRILYQQILSVWKTIVYQLSFTSLSLRTSGELTDNVNGWMFYKISFPEVPHESNTTG